MKDTFKKFFSELLSIDETRKSSVTLIFIALAVVSIIKFVCLGQDIPNNIVSLLMFLSGLIFGGNSIMNIAGIISSNKQGNQNNMYSGYNSYNSNGSNMYSNYGTNNYSQTNTTTTNPTSTTTSSITSSTTTQNPV